MTNNRNGKLRSKSKRKHRLVRLRRFAPSLTMTSLGGNVYLGGEVCFGRESNYPALSLGDKTGRLVSVATRV
jgi:hypothetical protein